VLRDVAAHPHEIAAQVFGANAARQPAILALKGLFRALEFRAQDLHLLLPVSVAEEGDPDSRHPVVEQVRDLAKWLVADQGQENLMKVIVDPRVLHDVLPPHQAS
jgi:hypothetical protein